MKKLALNFIGKVLIGFSFLFLFPELVCFLYHEIFISFLIPQVMSIILGFLFYRIQSDNRNFSVKDGFFIVSVSWILISILGALPLYFNGDCNYIDAFFEIVSGFTTTGATIFKDVEHLNHSILFWRSFSHFIGGMGVLAFVMAVIPLSAKDKSMHLLKAEMPGPHVEKLVPGIKKTLFYLFFIYFGLTIVEFFLLLVGGMRIFDALLISFGTAGTGGFSVLNTSLATYSNFCKIVVTLFMFLFGVNFNLYFLLLMKDFKNIFRSEELKVYIGLFLTSVIIVFISTYQLFSNVWEALLQSGFHVSSLMTSTGYSIGDINIYPTNCRVLMILLMLISACAGSTCGGFKISRLIICFKDIRRSIRNIISPNRVESILFEGQKVSDSTVKSTNTFLFLYVILIVGIFYIVSLDGFSFETTLNSVICTFANVGLCFQIENFSMFSDLSKLVLSFGMLLGRLEIFPVLSLFVDFKRS
ncbi:MAG: TrkH family potassium uptake protein [Bacilli bacterium]|nr:TrkH family potassium uptake protein [Bacilli bacterium]